MIEKYTVAKELNFDLSDERAKKAKSWCEVTPND